MRTSGALRASLFTVVVLCPFLSCADSGKDSGASTSASRVGADAGTPQNDAGAAGPGYTPKYDDPLFKEVFVDMDEWRDEPVRHRYVHGGFKDTDARFSIYFPSEDKYQGRFFQYILPVPGNEHAITTPEYADPSYTVGFAVSSGAYLVETNMGALGFVPTDDPEISLWRASAAAAEHSRVLANRYYPKRGAHRPYGYAWGGSGGAFKTIACIEDTDGVWDGVVPFIHASPVAMPNNFTVQAHAMRLLRAKLPGIVDAVDPGGGGDVNAGLNEDQRAALEEVTKFGFPPDAWFNFNSIAFGYTGVLASLLPAVQLLDSSYFSDFWSMPGYLGADHPEKLKAARVQVETSIAETMLPAQVEDMGLPLSLAATQPSNAKAPAALKLSMLPQGDLQGASITFKSGSAKGQVVQIAGMFGELAVIGYGQVVPGLAGVQSGDQVAVDNSVYLAIQSYHRHTLPGPDYHVYDQYRDDAGMPRYPQRAEGSASLFNQSGMMSGKFKGKMIVVESLMDEIAFAWHADWYRSRVKGELGDKLDDNYRLWFVEKAMHTPPKSQTNGLKPAIVTRTINYGSVLQQALRDMSVWVEKGTAPPASTAYEVRDGQVILPPTAADRKGVQAVVQVKANGASRADIDKGSDVTFSATVDVPPDAGSVVGLEWDFDGSGDFAVKSMLPGTKQAHVQLDVVHRFDSPGTYFPALRVSSQRQADAETPYARIHNLGRVRVVVK